MSIKLETLIHVLNKIYSTTVINASCRTKQLHGGTLGDVQLVTGIAATVDKREIPYKVVLKIQKKWERPGDPNSWRREYDLYASDLGKSFTDLLRWPECYHMEINDEESQIWMEYIEGLSGSSLTLEMLEQASYELGRFQGRLSNKSDILKNIKCFGDVDFLEREFSQWHTQTFTYDFLVSEQCRIPDFLKQMLKDGRIQLVDGKSFEYSYLRSTGCGIPEHLKQLLIDVDDRKDEIFNTLKTLPIVLCHRDFWIENIFFSAGKIRLIDWDTTGWGFLGEDIASLIVDEMDAEGFEENFNRLVPSYLKGLSEFMDVPAVDKKCIWDMILIKFGYRMMQQYMFTESGAEEVWGINALQKLYEIMEM